ncbi:MAG: hypothetical protein IT258_18310, partial [Saprospiraceae bacterium]|nr:hypothetical protein [Saprospiraceae bacterium]
MEKRKLLFLVLLLSVTVHGLRAQPSFQKQYPLAAGNSSYSSIALAQATNGNFYMGLLGGYKAPAGLFCISEQGTPLWGKYYHALKGSQVFDLVATNDGGVVLLLKLQTGPDSTYFEQLKKLAMVRFDSIGNLLWDVVIGETFSQDAFPLAATSDGGFVTVFDYYHLNTTQNDAIYIVKVDHDGNIIISGRNDSPSDDYVIDLITLQNGHYLVATGNHYDLDGGTFLLNLYDSGSGFWINKIQNFQITKVSEVSSNQYLIAGFSTDTGNLGLIRFSAIGNGINPQILWAKQLNLPGLDGGEILIQPDKSFLYVPYSQSINGRLAIKLDKYGEFHWARRFLHASQDYAFINEAIKTRDGGYAFSGNNFDSIGRSLLVKTDSLGQVAGCDFHTPCLSFTDFSPEWAVPVFWDNEQVQVDTSLNGTLTDFSFTDLDFCTDYELPMPSFSVQDTICLGDCLAPQGLQ